jgi:RNA polymerase sigma-70 factor, ECF subfamily
MTNALRNTPSQEGELLDAARGGDEGAYRRLVEARQTELHAHCYRMLGSVHDAEDALQDTLLQAWRALPRFEGRSSLRTWLFKIATNTCLNAIARRPKRVLPVDYGPAADPHDAPGKPLTESVWLEPYPDEELGLEDGLAAPEATFEQRESVELAFIAALQHLPARQRAALILRDVLGFSAREVAESLETTVPSVNSALQRARKAVDQLRPARSQQATLRALGDDGLRDVVTGYIDAWERSDVDAIVALLADDATWSMPPMSTWYRGNDAIVEFLSNWPLGGNLRWRHVPAHANGQPAVGCYSWDEERGVFTPHVLDVLTLEGDRIAQVTSFMTADIFPTFGLPTELPA